MHPLPCLSTCGLRCAVVVQQVLRCNLTLWCKLTLGRASIIFLFSENYSFNARARLESYAKDDVQY